MNHETISQDLRNLASAIAALHWIAEHGDTGEGGRPAFYDMRARARACLGIIAPDLAAPSPATEAACAWREAAPANVPVAPMGTRRQGAPAS